MDDTKQVPCCDLHKLGATVGRKENFVAQVLGARDSCKPDVANLTVYNSSFTLGSLHLMVTKCAKQSPT
jgi:hypothetical protein